MKLLAFSLVLLVACHQATAQGLTFTSTTYAVGSGPTYLAVADVNCDGKLDLICPLNSFDCADPGGNNGQGNTLLVLTNNGSGGFGTNATLTVGTGVIDVVAADVNGDGYVDLVSANRAANTLTVLTNNGSGGFGFSATLTVGNGPSCVVAADVNGDGKLDLICANSHANTLTVWFNNGSGGFVSNATLTVSNGPYCVTAADVNSDGYVDLITANYGSDASHGNTLTVLTNNGAGVFGFNATLAVGDRPDWVAAADVNGDGKLDLICANFGGNSWTVLTNNGSDGFVTSATISDPLPVGFVADNFAVGDFDGDGRVDLVCGTSGPGCNGGDNYLIVLTNNGSGSFGYSTTLRAGNKTNPVAADLNGDGKLDLAVANYLDGTVTVMMNTTIFPTPTLTPKLTIKLQGNGVRVAWPSLSPGWSLQQNTDLRTSKWLPSGYSGYAIADDGTNKSLTLPFPTGNLFFRLIHP
jgi:hypothetical protein